VCLLSLVIVGALVGCGGDGLGECPTDGAAQQTAGKDVVAKSCATCHGPTYANGMPAGGYDFTSEANVKAEAMEMYAEAEEGVMPPTGKLSEADLEALRVYLACTQ